MNSDQLVRSLGVLAENPRVFRRAAVARWRARRGLPPGTTMLEVGPIRVPYFAEFGGYLAALHFGSRDVAIRMLLERHLRRGDIFVDVGANIGRTSVVALGLVGLEGQVHAFEPVRRYRRVIEAVREANPQYRLVVNAAAVGSKTGRATIALSRENIGANSLVAGLVDGSDTAGFEHTEVVRLGDYLLENALEDVSLINVDAEGFELEVLRGLEVFWSATGRRPSIICEVNAQALEHQQASVADMEELLGRYGYQAHSVMNPRRRVDLQRWQAGDVLLRAREK